jgi:hypothetical protein
MRLSEANVKVLRPYKPYRVTGKIYAWHRGEYEEHATIDLDLTVHAISAWDATGRARQIAAQGYDHSQWRGDPTIEEVQEC